MNQFRTKSHKTKHKFKQWRSKVTKVSNNKYHLHKNQYNSNKVWKIRQFKIRILLNLTNLMSKLEILKQMDLLYFSKSQDNKRHRPREHSLESKPLMSLYYQSRKSNLIRNNYRKELGKNKNSLTK